MTEELKLFLEDSDEQLNNMEASLINMQDGSVNEEDIGALFRAMHTIKGTAGMFGFDQVVHFAHTAENLLSEVRSNNVSLTPDMIEVFLLCKDHTEILINLEVEQQAIDEDLKEVNKKLLDQLLSFMPNSIKKESSSKVEPKEDKKSIEQKSDTSNLWHISIKLKPDFFSSGMDILSCLTFLGEIGKVVQKVPIISSIPEFENINPIQAYFGFEILFEAQSSYAEIEEVFEFVIDDLELVVISHSDHNKLKTFIDSQTNKDEFIKLLLENSLISKNEFDKLYPATKPTQPTKDLESSKQVQDIPKINNTKSQKTVENKQEVQKSFSLRVDSSKVDQLINQISEMVIANAKIAQRADFIDDTELSEATTIMSDMLEEVRSSVMNIRMVQVGDSFSKFRRIVGDVAKKLGKNIDFTINGGETELDKMVVEKISDPIMHILRNSVDHGVEKPKDRVSIGKSEVGSVTLSAYPDAGTIVIKITDDGKGLNKDAIVKKAILNGSITADQNLTDKEIYNLIFAAGLTTAQEVSDISGRGVGMDVVKRNISDLRGTVEIDSKDGEGSIFTIRLPLTLAIIDGFLIQAGDTKYIIPLDMIQECIELSSNYKKQMKGNDFINLRDYILPLLNIREYFNEGKSKTHRENVVVVRYGDYKMGLLVDELYGEFQTVIKPLGEVFENVPGISGGTILGSGEIALIFDIPKLMEYKIRDTSL